MVVRVSVDSSNLDVVSCREVVCTGFSTDDVVGISEFSDSSDCFFCVSCFISEDGRLVFYVKTLSDSNCGTVVSFSTDISE